MAEPSPASLSGMWGGVIIAMITSAASVATVWWNARASTRAKSLEGESSVILARIARESIDRDQLVGMLRDRVAEQDKHIRQMQAELEKERDERITEQMNCQRRLLRLMRLRAADSMRISALTQTIIAAGLPVPLQPSIESFDDGESWNNGATPPAPS